MGRESEIELSLSLSDGPFHPTDPSLPGLKIGENIKAP